MSGGMARRWDHLRTSRIVLTGLWADAVLVMAASAWNGGLAFEALGQHIGEGIALGVAVDVGLAVSLIGDRALHLHGKSSHWGRALRVVTALMSLALNCGVSIWLEHYGVAVFHAFLPILLVLLSEYAQDTTLKFGEIADEHAAAVKAEQAPSGKVSRSDEQVMSAHSLPDPAPPVSPQFRPAMSAPPIGNARADIPDNGAPTVPAFQGRESFPTPRPVDRPPVDTSPTRSTTPRPPGDPLAERVAALVDAAPPGRPPGRRTVARELDLTEYRAGQLLAQVNHNGTALKGGHR